MVVLAIMAVVAGLIVGLASVSGDNKKIKRTEAELANLVTLIEQYKTKVGVYPPSTNAIFPERNVLLYELAGAIRRPTLDPLNPNYETPYWTNTANELNSAFGVNGIVNARDAGNVDPDANRMHPILKNLKSDQFAALALFPTTRSLVVPIDDKNGQRPNPWRYLVGSSAAHNPESFDLWVEIKLGATNGVAKTKIIGNWKN